MNELISADLTITDEAFRVAKGNGISRKNVRQRYWDYGWDIEKAITEPVIKFSAPRWPMWKEIAEKNGVSSVLFNVRIGSGMTPEEAATKPKRVLKEYKKSKKGKGKYTCT
jgi:hypothetical protein